LHDRFTQFGEILHQTLVRLLGVALQRLQTLGQIFVGAPGALPEIAADPLKSRAGFF
jgi:hypothetical protein